jgi:hypothetical protein
MNEMDRKLDFLKGIMQMIVDCVKFDKDAKETNKPEYQLNPNLLNLKRKSKYIESFVHSIRGKIFSQ